MVVLKILVAFALVACEAPRGALGAQERPEEFFRLPPSEQKATLRRYPLEKQLDLFFFGNQVRHPPAFYLASPLASQGAVLLPVLEGRLRDAQDGIVVRDIAFILREMAIQGVYDVSREPRCVDSAERRARELGGLWESTTLKLLEDAREVARRAR